jgi:Mg-chelatase subunit ChlD
VPKQLDTEPTLFEPDDSAGGGTVFTQVPGPRDRNAVPGRPGGGPAGTTEDEARVLDAVPVSEAIDPEALRRARRIAAQLSLARPRRGTQGRRGDGRLTSVRYAGGSDDIDLDATLEVLAERPVPEEEDIIVRERIRTRRAVVLAVDISGSMRGERVRTAAATVGALAGGLVDDELAVVAFWADAVVLAHLGQPVAPARLLETLLRVPALGLTNVAFPLEVAGTELARVPTPDARVLLLSDCVHNAGPDPRLAAARLPRLDVLLDTSGAHDEDLARDLARVGHGRMARVGDERAVAPAVSELFLA